MATKTVKRDASSVNDEISKLKKDLNDLKRDNRLIRQNHTKTIKDIRYLNDRIRVLENRSNFFDRTIQQIQNTVFRIQKIFG